MDRHQRPPRESGAGLHPVRELVLPAAARRDWRLLPAVQAFYETTAGETWYGTRTGEHAARTLLVGPALDVFWRNLSLTTSVQWTAADRTPADHPVPAGRVVLGLTYSLPQMRYLLGK